MTLTALPTIADPTCDLGATLDLDHDLRCECEHRHGPCDAPATACVTAVCQVVACDCGAWLALACAACLSAWEHLAREEGVQLCVHPLG